MIKMKYGPELDLEPTNECLMMKYELNFHTLYIGHISIVWSVNLFQTKKKKKQGRNTIPVQTSRKN